MDEAAQIAKAVADKTLPGDPRTPGVKIGPVVNGAQWDKVQGLIEKGVEEGATLVAGGPGGLPTSTRVIMCARPCSPT